MTSVSRMLRLKVSLGVSLVLILLLAPLNWVQYELQRRSALHELELLAAATGTLVVQGLESAMMTKNRRGIQAIVDSVVDTEEIRSVYILDPGGRVAASPYGAHNDDVLARESDACQSCHRLPAAERPRGIAIVDVDGQPVFRTMTPIINRSACHQCHDPEQRLNGVFYMDFAMGGLNARLEDARRTAFWGSVAIIALCALAIYGLMSWLVITPLERIAQGMRRFGWGQRSARVAVQTQDEVGLLAATFNDMAGTIQAQEAESQELYAELEVKDQARQELLTRLITAREEEQQRLARRIHDVLSQLLTGLSLYLKLGEDAVPAEMEEVRTHLRRANEVVRETIDQSHGLITELRPSVLDDYGLIPALEDEIDRRLGPLNIPGELTTAGEVDSLPVAVKIAAYRIAQEALINVIRHADAHAVHIDLRRTAHELIMTMDDDGTGASNGYRGTGILGMQERAAALGGRVDVTARPPHGTEVRLILPLDDEEA